MKIWLWEINAGLFGTQRVSFNWSKDPLLLAPDLGTCRALGRVNKKHRSDGLSSLNYTLGEYTYEQNDMSGYSHL